ncbi:uncharacterized protein LAESUDRAFT_730943 [Laetiporus sulphureus 93-53]|uniref:Uncharacterized protein n=1 Tax=Laetiporus sulphureus 93-53 TaxID=1314785 RepID=A0A165BUF9_9APHY|nr:uncharacterized protein LAESUDRAFT_730943 [Laetiporus sulphureus 93-53]KZT01672.1 hypothetical protein LAESUDRAFT_730943 [Laetiporus sulphureus 93-53]
MQGRSASLVSASDLGQSFTTQLNWAGLRCASARGMATTTSEGRSDDDLQKVRPCGSLRDMEFARVKYTTSGRVRFKGAYSDSHGDSRARMHVHFQINVRLARSTVVSLEKITVVICDNRFAHVSDVHKDIGAARAW